MTTRKRRSRFTCTMENGTQFYALAYTAEQVRDHYSRLGPVKTVVKGDTRIKAAKESIKGRGGFVLDNAAIDKAIEELGIKHPVKIRFNGRVGSTAGNHRLRQDMQGRHYHDIMLKSYALPDDASFTLWHELTHALQAERAGGTVQSWLAEQKRQARWPYKSRPVEREANAVANAHHNQKLCR